MAQLAWNWHKQGRHDETVEMMDKARELCRVAIGPTHPATGNVPETSVFREKRTGWLAANFKARGSQEASLFLFLDFHTACIGLDTFRARRSLTLRVMAKISLAISEQPSLGCPCDFIVVGSDFLDPDSSLVDSCKSSVSCSLIAA